MTSLFEVKVVSFGMELFYDYLTSRVQYLNNQPEL
jgi:hypothetical protein